MWGTRRVEIGAAERDFRAHFGGGKGRLDALVGRTEVVRISKGLGRGAGIVVGC